MATTTSKIACPAGLWTEVAVGVTSALIWGPPSGYRVAVGAAAPADLTIGVLAGRGESEGVLQLLNLSAGVNVYVTPAGAVDIVVQVIA